MPAWHDGCRASSWLSFHGGHGARILSHDEYESIFGEIVEDNGSGKQVVSISVAPAKWEKAKRQAAQLGIGISEYIERLLEKE